MGMGQVIRAGKIRTEIALQAGGGWVLFPYVERGVVWVVNEREICLYFWLFVESIN